MSEEQDRRRLIDRPRQEWIYLIASALAGLAFILSTVVFPQLLPFADSFAIVNIILFLCSLFSPYALLLSISDADRSNRRNYLLGIVCYLAFAPIVGIFVAYLARGDIYFYGLIAIPNELSWIVVAIIATLLLIPIINWFSLLPIAIWLGILLYYKGFQSSYLLEVLIGSPLFMLPLFIFFGYGICRRVLTPREEYLVYHLDRGNLTSHRPRATLKELLAMTAILLVASSSLVTGIAISRGPVETRVDRSKVTGIYTFQLNDGTSWLTAAFQLVNSRNETTASDGRGQLYIYDGKWNLIYSEQFTFSAKGFYKTPQCWTYTKIVSKGNLKWIVPDIDKSSVTEIAKTLKPVMSQVSATLKINLDSGKTTLTSRGSAVLSPSEEEVEKTVLQAALDKQWSFKVRVGNYVRIGNYSWAVIERTGGEIIFYPSKIYGRYIIHSTDGGNYWDILWKGDATPLFNARFVSEKTVDITTPDAIFHTVDGGKTWRIEKR